jgi:L-amino acid N-acyltransferase
MAPIRARLPSLAVGSISIRPATAGDAEQIRTIYNHEVLHTVATFDLVPRSLDDQRQWLAERSGAFTTLVAVDADDTTGDVLGFGALSPYKERAAYRTSVEDSVYVRRDCHGRGIGRLLLGSLLDVAEASGFHAVFARISTAGDASTGLHRACGFWEIGVEREVGRKFGRWLDVVVMQVLLHERGGSETAI